MTGPKRMAGVRRRHRWWAPALVGLLLICVLAVCPRPAAGEVPRIGVLLSTPMTGGAQDGFR